MQSSLPFQSDTDNLSSDSDYDLEKDPSVISSYLSNSSISEIAYFVPPDNNMPTNIKVTFVKKYPLQPIGHKLQLAIKIILQNFT